jgi:putative transposase
MPENARFKSCLTEIESGFVEREATPKLLMKLDVQLHLAIVLFLDTILIFGIWC